MNEDYDFIETLSRHDLEQHYLFLLNCMGILIHRAGGVITISKQDIRLDALRERMFVHMVDDKDDTVILSLREIENEQTQARNSN
jgi:hypothetical protein